MIPGRSLYLSLTYSYNCKPHTSTYIAPFDLSLSKSPGLLALQKEPSIGKSPQIFRTDWNLWLKRSLLQAEKKLQDSQKRYKKNFDARLRLQKETISKEDHVFLRVEQKTEKNGRHKLAPTTMVPYPVIKIQPKTVIIELEDKTHELVSLHRVGLSPKPLDSEKLERTLLPLSQRWLMLDEFPASEETGIHNLLEKVSLSQNVKTVIVTRQQTRQLMSRLKNPTVSDTEQDEAPASELDPPDFSVPFTDENSDNTFASKRQN